MKYNDYLQSAAWKRKSELVKKRDGYKCVFCGGKAAELDTHHMTYKRIGNEKLSDLVTLCRTCHSLIGLKNILDKCDVPLEIPGFEESYAKFLDRFSETETAQDEPIRH